MMLLTHLVNIQLSAKLPVEVLLLPICLPIYVVLPMMLNFAGPKDLAVVTKITMVKENSSVIIVVVLGIMRISIGERKIIYLLIIMLGNTLSTMMLFNSSSSSKIYLYLQPLRN